MLGAVLFGHEQSRTITSLISEFAAEVGTEAWDWQGPEADADLAAKMGEIATDSLTQAYTVVDKLARRDQVSAARAATP